MIKEKLESNTKVPPDPVLQIACYELNGEVPNDDDSTEEEPEYLPYGNYSRIAVGS